MKRIAVAALLLLSSVASRATTYKMMSDDHLADAASAIAQVRVTAVEPSPAVGMPSTDYLVEIEKLVKGFVPGSTLVVRVPGGIGADGLGLKIWGAPAFRTGERALLFLAPHDEDGTYRVVQMMLGAFHVVEKGGRRFALRDLSEAQELVGKAGGSTLRPGIDRVRELSGFTRWLEDRAAGRTRAADYLATAPVGALESNFTFLLPEDGFAIRWFRFDTGLSVRWRVNQSGQAGVPVSLALSSLGVAVGVWNDDSSSNINYGVDGTTSASNGLGRSDDISTILFNDPSDQVQGSFDCDTGGVIAAGGPFFFDSTREYRGVRYHEAVEADIVTNDGTDCFFNGDAKTVEEIFGHELGHTLGLGHSSERQALMFANAHADGRGASLNPDDRAGIAVLYGDGSTPPPPPPPPPGLKTPTHVVAMILNSTKVKLTWTDNSTVEEQVLVERKRIGGSWRQVLALPANSVTATVTGLTPGKPYAFRLRVKKGTAFSPYSETVRTANLPAH
ncbi:MAG: matrixin family metalloprotease [Acidobacteriota bacterium]